MGILFKKKSLTLIALARIVVMTRKAEGQHKDFLYLPVWTSRSQLVT